MPTVKELQDEAKRLGVANYSKMRKPELEAALKRAKAGPVKTAKRTRESKELRQTRNFLEICLASFKQSELDNWATNYSNIDITGMSKSDACKALAQKTYKDEKLVETAFKKAQRRVKTTPA